MRKLTVFLALALGLALVAGAAYAEVQNVKVSGDITVKGIYLSDLDFDNGKDNSDFALSITRLRVDADLTDNVGATIRLLNERDWDTETSTDTQIDLDLAYITLKEMLYSPATVSIGRQNIRLGNALIIGDPDTNANSAIGSGDLSLPIASARKAFDAVRVTLDYDPLIVDVIYAKINEVSIAAADDTNVYGLNFGYAFADYNAQGELYFIAEHNSNLTPAREINVFGVCGSIEPIEALTLSGEAAFQFGDYASARDVEAWAMDLGGVYVFNAMYTPIVGLGYSFRSGEKAGTSTGDYEAWDPLYEDQTQGLLADYLFAGANGGVSSNAHIIKANLVLTPMDDVNLAINYYHYILDEKFAAGAHTGNTGGTYTMKADDDLGNGLDVNLIYNYTEDVQLDLLGCIFWPGDAFDTANDDAATALVGTVSVNF